MEKGYSSFASKKKLKIKKGQKFSFEQDVRTHDEKMNHIIQMNFFIPVINPFFIVIINNHDYILKQKTGKNIHSKKLVLYNTKADFCFKR